MVKLSRDVPRLNEEMFETGRRSATSTSELGLYSDRSDHYHRNRFALGVRKYVVAMMLVLAVILISVLLYDFTSSATVGNHDTRETKHIYILQKALKRPGLKRTTENPVELEKSTGNVTQAITDRSDDDLEEHDLKIPEDIMSRDMISETRSVRPSNTDVKMRSQNLNNFNVRKKLLSMLEDESEEKVYGKQLFDNHALFHRLKQRYQNQIPDEDFNGYEEARPIPFHFEYKTPVPTSFKRPKYPQLSQYRYPHSSNNIQDIIKYLTRDNDNPPRGIKFSGVYVNPKKFDFHTELDEATANSDRPEEEHIPSFGYQLAADPLYQYKPKHPSDVNLLATPNIRLPISGFHRYNSYGEPYFPRPQPLPTNGHLVTSSESQYDNSHATTVIGKKRKAKPISVMLDIYPIPDSIDVSRKSARPRSGPSALANQGSSTEDYQLQRPALYNRGSWHLPYAPPAGPISLIAVPGQQNFDDSDQQQQMIFHLNLYPKRRNKFDRNEDISRSPRDENFPALVVDPISKGLADHSVIEASKFAEKQVTKPLLAEEEANRYEETELSREVVDEIIDDKNNTKLVNANDTNDEFPWNHRPESVVENLTKFVNESTKVSRVEEEKICKDCKNGESVFRAIGSVGKSDLAKDIDTMEGFQDFADGLLATD